MELFFLSILFFHNNDILYNSVIPVDRDENPFPHEIRGRVVCSPRLHLERYFKPSFQMQIHGVEKSVKNRKEEKYD